MSCLEPALGYSFCPHCPSALERKPPRQKARPLAECAGVSLTKYRRHTYSLETWVIVSLIKGIVLENQLTALFNVELSDGVSKFCPWFI